MALIEHQVSDWSLWIRADQEWDCAVAHEIAEHYDRPEVQLARAETVLDIGAHIGAFSRYVKHVNPKATIRAVELDRDNAAIAYLNVEPYQDVAVFAAWCGYELPENAVLWRAADNTGNRCIGSGHPGVWKECSAIEIDVPRLTLEELTSDWAHIDVLKIDCEGAEYDILGHCDDATLAKVRCIVGEFHDGYDRFMSELWPRLSRWFDMTAIMENVEWGLFCMVSKEPVK